MASEYDLVQLQTARGEAGQAQFSTSDYGAVGDQRPYVVVQPAYGAPKFIRQFSYLEEALRECGTLCQLTGQPYKLMKWGARVPCFPCSRTNRTSRLPNLRIHSPGALAGFPHATPIADFLPGSPAAPQGQRIVYGPTGAPKLVGAPNYIVTRTPTPPASFVDPSAPIGQNYLQAVQTAMRLADMTGTSTYLCSSSGADCKSGGGKWLPVVYVQPGGIVRRYPKDLPLKNSAPGSIAAVSSVNADEFRELVRESEGASRLAWGT